MDFTFPKEYELFRRMVREFAENEAQPLTREIDEQDRVPFETLEKAAKLGLLGVPFPQKYGGCGAGEMGYCILMEELNKACPSTAAIIGAHTGIGAIEVDSKNRSTWSPWPGVRKSPLSSSQRPMLVLMQRPSRPEPCVTAIIISSTAPRPSTPTAATPIFSASWLSPIPLLEPEAG